MKTKALVKTLIEYQQVDGVYQFVREESREYTAHGLSAIATKADRLQSRA